MPQSKREKLVHAKTKPKKLTSKSFENVVKNNRNRSEEAKIKKIIGDKGFDTSRISISVFRG